MQNFPSSPCYLLILEISQILSTFPSSNLDYPSPNFHNFSFQPSQTLWTVTIDLDWPSSSLSDSYIVFICSARSQHPASQPCYLYRSLASKMIMYLGRIGGFWIWCHLIMSDYRHKYANKHGVTTKGMSERRKCTRIDSPIDEWMMHAKRCALEWIIMQICVCIWMD